MKLNRNSWHYKIWANSFDTWNPAPTSTDLCRYCHRIFWQLFGYALVGCVILLMAAVVLFMGYLLIWKALIPHVGTTLLIGGGIVVAGVIVWLYCRWLNGKRQNSQPKTLVGQYLQANKDKVCPLVEFDDEE